MTALQVMRRTQTEKPGQRDGEAERTDALDTKQEGFSFIVKAMGSL